MERPSACRVCDAYSMKKCPLCKASFCIECFSKDDIMQQQCYSCQQNYCIFCPTYIRFCKEGNIIPFQCSICRDEMSKVD